MNIPRMHGVPSDDIEHGRAARLAPAGFVDELGHRSLSFNPATETIVETLHLRREFALSPEFEAALRARVAQVGRLPEPALATVQSVERTNAGLALVSKYASGRRLSELAAIDAGPGQAFDVIRRVMPALATLHRASPGSGHGALSLNRLVMTRDKRLIVVEHVLAPAMESLRWSRSNFNDLGLVVADAVPVRLDERADLRQVGWLLVSLMLGRALPPDDYPAHAHALLAEARRANAVLGTTQLGEWLERMLQLRPDGFSSAQEAGAAYEAFAGDPALEAAEVDGALLAFPSETPPDPPPQPPAPRVEVAKPAPTPVASPVVTPVETTVVTPAEPPVVTPVLTPVVTPIVRPIDRVPRLHAVPPPVAAPAPLPARAPAVAPAAPLATPALQRRPWIPAGVVGWFAGTLLAVAIAQGVAIILLIMNPRIIVPARPIAATEQSALPPVTIIDGAPAGSTSGAAPVIRPPSAPAVPPPQSAAALGQQVGRLNILAPVALDVFRDNAVIGSTAAPVSLPAGRHSLVLANRALGFRITQMVTVTNGQITPVRISIPNVLVSVNAEPWADVTIDGVARGQTPLANVSLPIGSHDFVFRHPDLGERRQTVLVRADTPTRVTQNFK